MNTLQPIASALLREAGAESAEVLGLLLYGSRVTGHARPDSDVDGLVLFRAKSGPASFEFHGHREGLPFDLELKFRTEEALRAEIDERDLLRMVNVATGRIEHDPAGILEGLQARARAACELSSGSLVAQLEAEPLLALLRISAVELRGSLLELAPRAPFAAMARLAEFLVDLHLYTEILVRAREGAAAPALGLTAMLATGNRTARLLQTGKFPTEPSFTFLLAEIEKAVASGAFVEQAFAAIEKYFQGRAGVSLLVPGQSALLKG